MTRWGGAGEAVELELPEGMVDMARLGQRLAALQGQPIDAALSTRLVGLVVEELDRRSHFLADVYVPPQQVVGGEVTVIAQPARVGALRAQGQQYTAGEALTCRIGLREGDWLDLRALASDVAFVNRGSPWRRSNVVFAQGEQPGTTDVVLQTQEVKPERYSLVLDNTGNRSLGESRLRLGASLGNFLGRADHRLDLGMVTGLHEGHYVAHTLGYSLPWGGRDVLSASAEYSETDVALSGGLFNATGANWSVGLSVNRFLGLGGGGKSQSELTAGVEFKSIGSALSFNQTPVSNTTVRVAQVYGQWSGRRDGTLGTSEATLRLTVSPGQAVAGSPDGDFAAARPGARSRFWRVNASGSQGVGLPGGTEVQAGLRAQWASGALISSERMSLSGSQGVRGFREDTLSADSGLVLSLEWRGPYWRPGGGEDGGGSGSSVVQPVLFLEAGRSFNETVQYVADLGSAGTRHTLVAHGAGLRWWLGTQLALRVDVARHHMGLPGEGRWRAHGSLTLSF